VRMAKPKERRIVLPDSLPLPGKRPGPAERKSDSYLELASALRSKELLSEWLPGSAGDATSELQLREALTRTLSDHASFGYIRENSKLPHSHPKDSSKIHYTMSSQSGSSEFLRPNGTEWLGAASAPRSGNWSVIPQPGSRLLVFDLDVSKSSLDNSGESTTTSPDERLSEARRSLNYLEALLESNLRGTYAQLSPSGGIHIFVLLPEGVDPSDLPAAKISDGMRELAGVPLEHREDHFRGDIRSGASNGFILMAGSRIRSVSEGPSSYYRPLVSDSRWNDFRDYRSGRKLRLLELTPSAVDRLRRARSIDLAAKARRMPSPVDRSRLRPSADLIVLPRTTRELQSSNYRKLIDRLAAASPRSYHAARAHIYRALSCCASPEAIAELCRDAGYGKDTHRGRELSDSELLADMESMDRRGFTALRCGPHCGALWGESTGSDNHRSELESLVDAIRSAKLLDRAELSVMDYQRVEESSLLEARSLLQRRTQRDGDYGLYGKRKPTGLNYRRVTEAILGERTFAARMAGEVVTIAGYRQRALELTLGYFAPLFAAGASAVIAPAEELMARFGWSRSQLREALRFLRSLSVLSLEHRQVTGKSSTYAPGKSRFFDPILSSKLRAAWGESRVENEAGEKAFLGGFFDYSRGRIVRADGSSFTDSYLQEIGGSYSGLLVHLDLHIPQGAAFGAAFVGRYLSKAIARHREISNPQTAATRSLRNLASEGATPEPLQPIEEQFLLLGARKPKSREDRSAFDFGVTIHGRSLWRRRGDRSPSEDPG